MNTPTDDLIFKILGASEWASFQDASRYEGSADDARDGFIHLSRAGQVAGTAAKHFTAREDLVLVAVRVRELGEALVWEPSRGGALFPHVYGELALTAVAWSEEMPLGPDNLHVLPSRLTL